MSGNPFKDAPKSRGVVLIFAANILFAINMPVSRSLTPDWLHPLALSFLRISFAWISFHILSLLMVKRVRFTFHEHLRLLLCGFLGTAANQISFITGLARTSPVDASLIITVTPILTMLFAALIIKEPITFKKVAGVFAGLTGAFLILYNSHNVAGSLTTGTLKGNLIVLVSSFVFALYLVVVRPLMLKYPPVEVMKWSFLYGTVMAAPFCIKHLGFKPGADTVQYLQLGYTLVFGTFISYLLVSLSQKLLRPTTVSMFNYVQPLIASFIAIVIGQDVFNWNKPLSSILIFTGVYLVIKSKSKEDIECAAKGVNGQ